MSKKRAKRKDRESAGWQFGMAMSVQRRTSLNEQFRIAAAALEARSAIELTAEGLGGCYLYMNGFDDEQSAGSTALALSRIDMAGCRIDSVVSWDKPGGMQSAGSYEFTRADGAPEVIDFSPHSLEHLHEETRPVLWASSILGSDAAASQGFVGINAEDLHALIRQSAADFSSSDLLQLLKIFQQPNRVHVLVYDSDWEPEGDKASAFDWLTVVLADSGATVVQIRIHAPGGQPALNAADLCGKYDLAEYVMESVDAMRFERLVRSLDEQQILEVNALAVYGTFLLPRDGHKKAGRDDAVERLHHTMTAIGLLDFIYPTETKRFVAIPNPSLGLVHVIELTPAEVQRVVGIFCQHSPNGGDPQYEAAPSHEICAMYLWTVLGELPNHYEWLEMFTEKYPVDGYSSPVDFDRYFPDVP